MAVNMDMASDLDFGSAEHRDKVWRKMQLTPLLLRKGKMVRLGRWVCPAGVRIGVGS